MFQVPQEFIPYLVISPTRKTRSLIAERDLPLGEHVGRGDSEIRLAGNMSDEVPVR